MSPFRWDVLLVAFVLALPVLLLGLRGDLSGEEMTARLPWCLAAGWGAVAVVRLAAGTPPTTAEPKPTQRPPHRPAEAPTEVDEGHSPVS